MLRNLDERLRYLRNLEERKEQVISSIREQEKLTPELEKQIQDAPTLVSVEDLYRPYRPKRRTRAIIAKEKGLEPLANVISLQMIKEPLEQIAKDYVSEEKGVATVKDAIAGAKDILAETVSTMPSTALISGKRPWNRECCLLLQKTKRFLLFTKCITTMRNQ